MRICETHFLVSEMKKVTFLKRYYCVQIAYMYKTIYWSPITASHPPHLRSVFGDLPDECGHVLLDVLVGILETREHGREDLGLHHHLRQVHRVLGDLGQRGEHLALWAGFTFIIYSFWLKMCNKLIIFFSNSVYIIMHF